jgi:hypothetical protein
LATKQGGEDCRLFVNRFVWSPAVSAMPEKCWLCHVA